MHVRHKYAPRLSPRRYQAGFTLVELVMTMILIGILAYHAMPSFTLIADFETVVFRDQVVAALRYAQKSAVSHRRLVCADVTPTSITLRIASTNPASNCGGATLNGPDGQSAYASTSKALISGDIGTMYFQPSGTVTSSNGSIADYNLSIFGGGTVAVAGATGYVN